MTLERKLEWACIGVAMVNFALAMSLALWPIAAVMVALLIWLMWDVTK